MPPLLEFNIFTILLFCAVGIMAWFLISREIGSTRRMKCMMAELGLDYDLSTRSDPVTEKVISQARGKCLRCRSEGLCERWLDAVKRGEALAGVDGDLVADDFCPNAGTFRELASRGELQAEPEEVVG